MTDTYIQAKNTTNKPRAEIEQVVRVYIDEAKKEHINHDIAIALMCEGTTLDKLLSNWVSPPRVPAYKNSINKILIDMYDFQNRGHS